MAKKKGKRPLKAAETIEPTGGETWTTLSSLTDHEGVIDVFASRLSKEQEHEGVIAVACNMLVEENDWDFTVPRVPAPSALASHLPPSNEQEQGYGYTPASNSEDPFSLRHLVGTIQRGEACESVRTYLTHYTEALGPEVMKIRLSGDVDDCPAIFYVVESGNAEMVRLWACYGADVNCTYRRIPLLGFAIALCQSFRKDMRLVITTLLSLGASVDVIPRAFYTPLDRDLPDDGPSGDELTDVKDESRAWCGPAVRQRIAKALNFSLATRYFLELASRHEPLSGANRQLAKVHKAVDLLGIRYFHIGQTLASGLLIERFLTYLAMPTDKPLVLLFAGPSGHGKAELARNLGRLLDLDFRAVNCTNLKWESDLFGPQAPYEGSKTGSAANNFLASQDAQRCIVFLDEFEKTGDEARKTLLVPFDSDEYRGRRLGTLPAATVYRPKTIWVLATNAFDTTIQTFSAKNKNTLFGNNGAKDDETKLKRLGRDLSRMIQRECIGVFGAPLTSRITDFIPFLPFSPIEQAAVADKCLADLGRELAKPVNICNEPSQYRPVGNVDLQVRRGYSVCKALASQGYVEELGARSIINTIDREVRMPLCRQYLESRDEIREDQPAGSFVVGVDADSEEVDVLELVVEE